MDGHGLFILSLNGHELILPFGSWKTNESGLKKNLMMNWYIFDEVVHVLSAPIYQIRSDQLLSCV